MELTAWHRTDVRKTKELKELTEDPWMLGYFHSENENWDGIHWIRKLPEVQIRDLVLFTLGDVKGKRILDVGCAQGVYLDIIAKMGGAVAGQDICASSVNAASRVLRNNGFNADMKVGDATKLLFDDNSFDGIISADFFEHITYGEKVKVISEAYRVLKPGGVFTIKTPNLDYLKATLLMKKILAVLKFKSPFNIYIAHTRDNPSSRHYGLTTYKELETLLVNNMFHFPKTTYYHLLRKNFPMAAAKFLYGKKRFTEQIIITAQKPLFYGYYPSG